MGIEPEPRCGRLSACVESGVGVEGEKRLLIGLPARGVECSSRSIAVRAWAGPISLTSNRCNWAGLFPRSSGPNSNFIRVEKILGHGFGLEAWLTKAPYPFRLPREPPLPGGRRTTAPSLYRAPAMAPFVSKLLSLPSTHGASTWRRRLLLPRATAASPSPSPAGRRIAPPPRYYRARAPCPAPSSVVPALST